MAPALVGVKGTSTTGATSAAITPPFGQSPTAGNLLICTVTNKGGTTSPTTPAGWTIAAPTQAQGGTATIFCLVALGGDTAPTIAAVTGQTWTGQCTEWSGCASSSPTDQSGGTHGSTTSSLSLACGSTDSTAGELVIWAYRFVFSSSSTTTTTSSLNNGATATTLDNNDSTSTTEHHSFGYGITTSNGSATTDSASWTTGTTSNKAGAIATFLLASVATASPTNHVQNRVPLIRASVF